MTDRSATLPTEPQTPEGRLREYLSLDWPGEPPIKDSEALRDLDAALAAARQQGRAEAVDEMRAQIASMTGGYPRMPDGRPIGVGGDAYDAARRQFGSVLDAIATQGGEVK